ncbi:Uncharacterised protein [Mycobacteroides abscessus subsp. abscessus]|nr:Uncharacterised protein [Mycobacteroides abscessus subsp. abscessus]
MSATLIVHDGVQRPFGTELGLIQSVEKARNHLGTTQVCHQFVTVITMKTGLAQGVHV